MNAPVRRVRRAKKVGKKKGDVTSDCVGKCFMSVINPIVGEGKEIPFTF